MYQISMNPNRAVTIASILQERRPLAEKIVKTGENLRSLDSALRYLDEKRQQILKQVDDGNIRERLQEIDCQTPITRIADELKALDKLKVRFCRDRLKIGVVGRARQGKSRLLQRLTGLTANEIPDGDRKTCTGVLSTISHRPDTETYADIWFYSEQSFLAQVIAPYYQKLGLGSQPITIEEFSATALPPLPSDPAIDKAMYEHLREYHANLSSYRDLLRTGSPYRATQDEIRKFVAQDTLNGERTYFYMAVEKADIYCSFPNADVGDIALVDMPGLGDINFGDEERLVKTLGQDIDVVLFVRKPTGMGDFWQEVDVQLYDIAREALDDLPLELWSFMVINRTEDNSKNCQDLAGDIAKKHIKVVNCAIANCDKTEEVNNVLDRVLEYLLTTTPDGTRIITLDKQYGLARQESLNELQNQVRTELNKAQNAFGKVANSSL